LLPNPTEGHEFASLTTPEKLKYELEGTRVYSNIKQKEDKNI
jgi:hypothetical protein